MTDSWLPQKSQSHPVIKAPHRILQCFSNLAPFKMCELQVSRIPQPALRSPHVLKVTSLKNTSFISIVFFCTMELSISPPARFIKWTSISRCQVLASFSLGYIPKGRRVGRVLLSRITLFSMAMIGIEPSLETSETRINCKI